MPMPRFWVSINLLGRQGGWGCTLFNGPYGEALAEKITFFRFEVYERMGVSLVEVYDKVQKSVIVVCERT